MGPVCGLELRLREDGGQASGEASATSRPDGNLKNTGLKELGLP